MTFFIIEDLNNNLSETIVAIIRNTNGKVNKIQNLFSEVLTVDFGAARQRFEIPIRVIEVFFGSISKEGNNGVPGGVTSLNRQLSNNHEPVKNDFARPNQHKKKKKN